MSNSAVPIKEFRLDLSDLSYTGHDLVRPESVLAQPNGTLWTSDGRGGVTRIDPDGNQQFLGGLGGEPNGLALADDGTIYVANSRYGCGSRPDPAIRHWHSLWRPGPAHRLHRFARHEPPAHLPLTCCWPTLASLEVEHVGAYIVTTAE